MIASPPQNLKVKGKEFLAKLLQSRIDMDKAAVKLKFRYSGNIAVAYQTYQLEATMKDNQVIKDNCKCIEVYEKQEDGNWMIKYNTWNSNLITYI